MDTDVFMLTATKQPLTRVRRTVSSPTSGQALVEILACGLCHTDLGFADGSVAPKHALPLVLGHEIVGTVIAAGEGHEKLVGKKVLVPAVMPCGDSPATERREIDRTAEAAKQSSANRGCPFCRAGRGNACPGQKMPGNDIDGGFGTHVLVPAHALVDLSAAPPHVDLRELSVVADAVSTAYQALVRAGTQRGDAVMVVGSGGVGGYAIQLAKAMGARVVALDVDQGRLEMIAKHGAERTVDVAGRAPKDVRKEVHGWLKELGIPSLQHRILECSGTPDGQVLAYTLLGSCATMVQAGYTAKSVEVRLSNLMAFDATVHGSWGCPVEAYPEVLRHIYEGNVVITPFVEHRPLSAVNESLADMAAHRLARRVIFDPRA